MVGRNDASLQQFVRRGSPRALPEEERRRLAGFFGGDEAVLGGAPAPPSPCRVPRLDVAASAGPGAFVDNEVAIGVDAIDPALARELGLRAGQAAIIRVRGDSMEPGLYDGDHIVVDTSDRSPRGRGGLFVVRIEGTVMVKRVVARRGVVEASSDNPLASPLPDAPVDIIGRVVWQMRRPR
jgi:phage repressor protein C with HTH and peptisase S24 domain